MNSWETVYHQDGRLYYWNTDTNETTWIKPKEIDEFGINEVDEGYDFYEENEENSIIIDDLEEKNITLEPPPITTNPPLCPKLYKCVSVKSSQESLSAIVRVKLQYRKSESYPVKMILTLGSNGRIMDHLWNMVNSQNIFIDMLKGKLRESSLEIYFEKCMIRMMQYSFRSWKDFCKEDEEEYESTNTLRNHDSTQIILNLLNDQLSKFKHTCVEKCIWNYTLAQLKYVFGKWFKFTVVKNELTPKYIDRTLENEIYFSGIVFSEYVKTKRSFEKRSNQYRKLANVLQERLSNIEKKYKMMKHEKNEFLRLLIEVKTSRAKENWEFMNGISTKEKFSR